MLDRISANVRRLVRSRANGRCEYCQTPEAFAPESFSIEHILPRSKKGTGAPENLALACQGCNNHKFTRTRAIDPLTGGYAALFHPRLHSWHTHFAWMPDARWLLEISATGRATVELLKLNRPGLRGLREALIAIGLHPPFSDK